MRTTLRLAARRAAQLLCRAVPLAWLHRLRAAYLDGRGSPRTRQALRAVLDVVRLRGVAGDEPFAVSGDLFHGAGATASSRDVQCLRMVPSDSYIASHLYWLGADAYEPGGPAWWGCLTSTHTSALEIGANIGLYTLVGARAAPGLHYRAVEPNPESCDALRRNLTLNGLDHVEVVERAVVGDPRRGTATLRFPDRDPYRSSCGAYVDGAVDLEPPASRAITVDAVAVSELVDGVDVAKLDVEGLELELLAAVRPWIMDVRPTLVVEVRDVADRLQRFVTKLVTDAGYETFAVTEGRVRPVPASVVARGVLESACGTRDVTLVAPHRVPAALERAAAAGLG